MRRCCARASSTVAARPMPQLLTVATTGPLRNMTTAKCAPTVDHHADASSPTVMEPRL